MSDFIVNEIGDSNNIHHVGDVHSRVEWGRAYQELTRDLKENIEHNRMDEVARIFDLREQLLQKLNSILKEDKSLGADDEFFRVMEVIQEIESECFSRLKGQMESSRKQLNSLVRLRRHHTDSSRQEPTVVSRYVDLKR